MFFIQFATLVKLLYVVKDVKYDLHLTIKRMKVHVTTMLVLNLKFYVFTFNKVRNSKKMVLHTGAVLSEQ